MKKLLKSRSKVTTPKQEKGHETTEATGAVLNASTQAPAQTSVPEAGKNKPAPFTAFAIRRVHDGVTWLYETVYLTIQGTQVIEAKSEAGSTKDIAESRAARDFMSLQYDGKESLGKLPEGYR